MYVDICCSRPSCEGKKRDSEKTSWCDEWNGIALQTLEVFSTGDVESYGNRMMHELGIGFAPMPRSARLQYLALGLPGEVLVNVQVEFMLQSEQKNIQNFNPTEWRLSTVKKPPEGHFLV